jgi:TolA-binding protein
MRRSPIRFHWFVLPAAAAAMTAVVGCAPSGDSQVQTDQLALRSMVANNQQEIDALEEKIQRLGDRVSELEHNSMASSRLASIEQRLKKLESQVAASSSGVANTATATPPAVETTNTPTANGAGSGSITGETAAAEAPAGPEISAVSTPSVNPPSWRSMLDQELAASYDDPGEKLYRQGLLNLKADRYQAAFSQFQALQHRYPKSELSEPAEFFAANALFEMGKYDQAILQFNDLTMRFPKGRFASAALLREAQAFIKINDRIDARLTLQKLLNDLPDAPEVPIAKSMMQTLAS